MMMRRASILIARPVEEVFDVAVDTARLPDYMTKVGIIPGVVAVERLDEGPPRVGSRRRVRMSDRSTLREEIIALEPPTRHDYRWLDPPGFPFSLLVRGATAEWTFRDVGGSTSVEWTYSFELTTALVYPLATLVMAMFRRWMMNALVRLKALVERR